MFEDPQWINAGGYAFWPDLANGGWYYILRENQPATARSLRVIEGWQAATNTGD